MKKLRENIDSELVGAVLFMMMIAAGVYYWLKFCSLQTI